MEENERKYIDMRLFLDRIMENKRLFIRILPIVFVVSCILVLCIPRYYVTDVKLVPEMGSSDAMGGTLGSLASSFGLDLANMETSDAITPLLYPDLLEDNAFVASLYNIRVKSNFDEDMPIDTTYYGYLRYYQKNPFWVNLYVSIKKMFSSKEPESSDSEYDPYNVSKIENSLMNKIRDNVVIDLDKKTGVIAISVETQDPYICRILADSVQEKLQRFIIDYRTRKARLDAEHYQELTIQAKAEYEMAMANYASFCDANMNSILQVMNSERDKLESEMQMHLNTYTTMQAQYQATMAKVQERTPAFTLIKGANVPVKHAGPKRMFMVAGALFFAAFLIVIYSLRKEILR